MKVQLNRTNEKTEVNIIFVFIGESKYSIRETIEGKLKINKSYGVDDAITINPTSGNEINLS